MRRKHESNISLKLKIVYKGCTFGFLEHDYNYNVGAYIVLCCFVTVICMESVDVVYVNQINIYIRPAHFHFH